MLSAYLRDAILDAIFNGAPFAVVGDPHISLHTADPGAVGSGEVSGGSYARQQAPFDPASGGISNGGTIDFADMPAATVTYVGVWDGAGNFLWGGPLGTPVTVTAGRTIRIAAGDLSATLT